MKLKILSIFLILALLLSSVLVSAQEVSSTGNKIYVSVETGNDRGIGTKSDPYKTIDRARR